VDKIDPTGMCCNAIVNENINKDVEIKIEKLRVLNAETKEQFDA